MSDNDVSEIIDIAWNAGDGKRDSEVPCKETILFGGLHADGSVG